MLLLFLVFFGILGFVGLVAFVVITSAGDKLSARASLRSLKDYDVEQLAGTIERAARVEKTSLTKYFVTIGRKYTPAGYINKTKKKLLIAGRPTVDDLDRFLARRVLFIVLAPVSVVVGIKFMPSTLTKFAFIGLALTYAIIGPDQLLSREVTKRQKAMSRQLPDILDMLTISVEAGLGFEQAVDRVVDTIPGPLTDEFIRMLGEMRAGSSRAAAMRGIDDRTDVAEIRSFILAILQADSFGVSIGRILKGQADEMRVKRRQIAQEEAQKVPVKMLLPMVFMVFPALFVVILGPAAIRIADNLVK